MKSKAIYLLILIITSVVTFILGDALGSHSTYLHVAGASNTYYPEIFRRVYKAIEEDDLPYAQELCRRGFNSVLRFPQPDDPRLSFEEAFPDIARDFELKQVSEEFGLEYP
ncbi:MAG: hypothetical protein AAF571_10645 [Verrucomicrobiota bacterium]